jgi:hypothetical protein
MKTKRTAKPKASTKAKSKGSAISENPATKAAREKGERAAVRTSTSFRMRTDVGWLIQTRASKTVGEALKRVIARFPSASAFDDWFCAYLDSRDGTDAKTYCHDYVDLFADDLWVGDLEWPANEPDTDWESFDKASKLKEWERVARNWSELLLAAQSLKLPCTAMVAAKMIGEIVAFRLEVRDFSAPRLVSEGLLNIKHGKPFKTGSKPSEFLTQVSAAYFTFIGNGIFEPSQAEVRAYLGGLGIPASASRISKAFDTLRLKSRAGDARRAQSGAGKRRRS